MTATIETLAEPGSAEEAELLTRVLSALLREDVVGLRTAGTVLERPDGPWLRHATADDALLLPLGEDGYQAEYAARLPLLVRESDGARLTTLDTVLPALRALADPVDHEGFDAFAEECRQTLETLRLHSATQHEIDAVLTERHGPDPAAWTGLTAGIAYDALAARFDHPVYPTSRGRSGLNEAQLRAYAPEFHSRLALRWLLLPRTAVTVTGGEDALPACWPMPVDLEHGDLNSSHIALPVHPLTVGEPLRAALRETGLTGDAVLSEHAWLSAVPTLSMRTVALDADPQLHLKLPLATATLGLRNRRTIKPRTLIDGLEGQRLLETVIAREPRFRDTILQADETVYAHADHELLAALCRRYPKGLDRSSVVPLAALLAPAPGSGDRLVIDHLADRSYGGDPLALLDAMLTLLFDWQTTLFGYGIGLESHQQNISLVLDRTAEGGTRLRLLFKDNDSPRINPVRMRERLGADAPDPEVFADPRIFTEGDGPVADMVATITLHLCAGSYAFGLARADRAPLDKLLGLIRDRLAEAVERLGTGSGEPGAVLRERLLDAPELPVKAMVSAGTLLSKERSGAADINKHYTTGPNYLLPTGSAR
ncbi:IucA/IucC family protein [Streptomyces sp. LHD-70]|uniref:IucA/IucC family protein n=1 Tax=Streptomyces sp. LHD-70 TaxID=3072140 RepID=UPI00280D18DD|nr:IucA/IucC family protein [Streptomyces sp. LHD-70]MDQ8703869.1 IucA/IucC family protein [Streptomyces sp. LHD-70]